MLIPIFETGAILKKPMLEALRDFPSNYINTIYSQYGEGILEGFDIIINENSIDVFPGVLKFNGNIYISSEKLSSPIEAGKKIVFLCIKEEVNQENCGLDQIFDLKTVETQLEDGIEICRYAKNSDGVLKHCQDFSDITNTMNRITMLNTKYSVKHGCSLSPEIFILFAKAMLKKELNVKDMSFAMQCLNNSPSLELLKHFFSFDGVLDNETLFVKMQEYLESLSSLKPFEKTEKVAKKQEGIML